MTVKEHLAAMHTQAAEHDLVKAKHHRAMAKHFSKLSEFHKAAGKAEMEHDPTAVYEEITGQHEKMADEHTAQAEYHTDCAKSMLKADKAAGMNDDGIVPDRVSGIVKHWPNIQLMPRHGAPSGPQEPNVPAQFAHLVKVEDE
jgi:hypothetical protein